MEEDGCNNTFIICRLDFQPILALRTLPNPEENKMVVRGKRRNPLEMGKKLRRVEDLEDIPDSVFGQFPDQKERSNLIGNIYEMFSDSCESQGGEMAENNRQTKKRSLKEES